MIGALIALPYYLGWGNHYFYLDSLNCMWDRLASRFYIYFAVMVGILIPLVLICIFYFKIYQEVRRETLVRKISDFVEITNGLFASCL